MDNQRLMSLVNGDMGRAEVGNCGAHSLLMGSLQVGPPIANGHGQYRPIHC